MKLPPGKTVATNHTKADWQFTTADARVKLEEVVPGR